jgi:alcohol dehydrogenase class IV
MRPPYASVIDPELTLSMPKDVTAHTVGAVQVCVCGTTK